MDLSVIIVNWNTRDLLRDCLRSIPAGLDARHSAEVWVVDNDSRDGSAAMVLSAFPEVHLIANSENAGFARANNQALRQAQGRHVLLLNSDVKVLDRALSQMLDFLDAHPPVGAVGCRLLNADGSPQRSCWADYPTLSSVVASALWLDKLPWLRARLRRQEARFRGATEPVRVKHLLGACLMVRREAVERVGPLDEGYFMYLEETDWCRRIEAAGWEIVFLPNAAVIHYGQQSAVLAGERATADWCRSMCRFYRRQYGPNPAALRFMKVAITASIVIRFGFNTARALARRDRKRPSLRGTLGALRALIAA